MCSFARRMAAQRTVRVSGHFKSQDLAANFTARAPAARNKKLAGAMMWWMVLSFVVVSVSGQGNSELPYPLTCSSATCSNNGRSVRRSSGLSVLLCHEHASGMCVSVRTCM